ncbi:hypothetical protein [Spirosoma gilvum]
MEINRYVLLSLGFTELADQPYHFVYRQIRGHLQPKTGCFHFQGFSLPVSTFDDLIFLMDLIDHQDESRLLCFPLHYN